MRKSIHFLIAVLALLLISCAGKPPLEKLKKELNKYPEYSIILEDMNEEGALFKDYYHRYKIIVGQETGAGDSLAYETTITDWLKVSKKDFRKYYNYLGMVIASKTRDGGVVDTPYPPGYQYVGNPRYGRWRQDSSGNSFWEWYGKFAFMGYMFGMFGRPIYRSDWTDYRSYRSRGQPYFGRNREYGTAGKYTKQTNKSFFQRRQQREAARKQKFAEKVKRRTRRSKMSGVRRRSGGFGK
ncbi:MAG: hypothetical protein ACE5GL_11865 [Calditrichia bacterium]